MLRKCMFTICAAGFVATSALAQGTPPPPPTGPTAVQCQEGYKEGMQWTKEQFTAACEKLRDSKKN